MTDQQTPVVEGGVEGTGRKGHTPDSWGAAEDDGGTRKQMANSSTVGDASSLRYVKRRKQNV